MMPKPTPRRELISQKEEILRAQIVKKPGAEMTLKVSTDGAKAWMYYVNKVNKWWKEEGNRPAALSRSARALANGMVNLKITTVRYITPKNTVNESRD